MTIFWIIATIMVLAAIAAVVPGLTGRRSRWSPRRDEATVAAYRARLKELEQERHQGNLSQEGFDAERQALEQQLATDLPDDTSSDTLIERPARTLAWVVAIIIPITGITLYGITGSPDQINATHPDRLTTDQVRRFTRMAPDKRIAPLETYVRDHPNAPQAWALLGRAYMATNRYGDAVLAFKQARQHRDGRDAELIAHQAQALVLANGQQFTNSAERLIEKALEVDARNARALLLAGHAALARDEREQAVRHWQHLADTMPEGAQGRAMVERLIARAQTQGDQTARQTSPASSVAGTAQGGGSQVTVKVELAEPLRADVSPDERVFIFARAADGDGGPPLAVTQTTVGRLPTTITLSDEQAMMPRRKLSQAQRVVLIARVSRSGDAIAQPGDLEGRSKAVSLGSSTRVTIDERVN